ncbi:NfrA family protein [Achromobacter spanius]|uniref:Bacteriophage N4 adsorption protein A C-terminal domain-containing protein n=1 Tax=Achromobacter spanius TaxID=217203 RepID=A0A2S0I4G9_9BURK|nr:hypothetical protein [Achromobacter spanius]AVJ26929.1 hypothetical protein CLM73_07215 [Achromobacter spanius]
MMSFPRSLVLSAALACAWAAAPVGAQTQPRAEAPLEGAAWQFADEGYKNYDAGNYALAQQQAESAIVLRPDVERLRLLLIYALQKQGKLDEADKAAADAIASGLDTPALRQARANLRPAPAARPAASPATPAAPRTSSAYQRGFPIATRAYADYNRADYPAAERGAERAFRIDPKQGAWAMLWLDALEAQGKYAEAEAAVAKAVSLGAPNGNDLAARQQTLKRRMAVKPAEAGYQALIANHPGDAVPLARQAVALAPESSSHRLLLITALMLDNQLAAAEEAATDAMRQDDENTVALLMRGYLRQRQGRTQEADADFDAALKQGWLDDEQRRNVRLIAADAALAAGENARALALVEPLGGKDEAAAQRIKRAGARPAIPATLTLANYPAPVQDCRDTPYGTSCELLPSDAAGSGGPASLAYAAYAREDYQEAISQARKAAEQDPANKEYQRLLTTTLAAGNAAQLAEANTRMSAALAAQPDDPTLLMQRGYLHQRMRQPKLALEDFQAARATGKAPPTVILDEGYALAGVGDKRGAVDRLKEAIDENDAGKLDLTPQQRFDTRNAIGGLAREWGGYFSAGYRGARPASSGLGGAAITVPGDAVFSTAEIFWRPSDFLNSSTRTFELYGRLSNTLYDKGSRTESQTVSDPCQGTPGGSGSSTIDIAESSNPGISGIPTTIGSLGMRFTPSTEVGLTFGLERQFNLGSATRRGTFSPDPRALRCSPALSNKTAHYQTDAGSGGWLAYVTYGLYEGTTLRIDRPDWFTMEGYVQAGYSWQDMPAKFWLRDNATGVDGEKSSGRLKRDQAFGAGELRVGRSYRVDAISERLVFFPYAVIGADWLWNKNRVTGLDVDGAESFRLAGDSKSWSMGAGPGFNLRYWFREDHYTAPMSYLDLTTQYRFNIGGGQADRAKGLFINLTLSY